MSSQTVSNGPKKVPFPSAAIWSPAPYYGLPAPAIEATVAMFPLIGMEGFSAFHRPYTAYGAFNAIYHPYFDTYFYCAAPALGSGRRMFRKSVEVTRGSRRFEPAGDTDPSLGYVFVSEVTKTIELTADLVDIGSTVASAEMRGLDYPAGGWGQAWLDARDGVGDWVAAYRAMLATAASFTATSATVEYSWSHTYSGGTYSGHFSHEITLSNEDTFADAAARAAAWAAAESTIAPAYSGSGTSIQDGELFVRASDCPSTRLESYSYWSADPRCAAYAVRYRHRISAAAFEGTTWTHVHKVKAFTAAPAHPEFTTYPGLVEAPTSSSENIGDGVALPTGAHPSLACRSEVAEEWLDPIPGGWRDALGNPTDAEDGGWADLPWFDRWLPGRTAPAAYYGFIQLRAQGMFYQVRITALDTRAGWKAKLSAPSYVYDPETDSYEIIPLTIDLGTSVAGGSTPPVFIGAADAEDPEIYLDYEPLVEIIDPDGNPIPPSQAGLYLRLEFQVREALTEGRYAAPDGTICARQRTTTTITVEAADQDFEPTFIRHLAGWGSVSVVEYDQVNIGTPKYVSFSVTLDGASYDLSGLLSYASDYMPPISYGGTPDVTGGGLSRTTVTEWELEDTVVIVAPIKRPGFSGVRPANSAPGTSGSEPEAMPAPASEVVTATATLSGGYYYTPWRYKVVDNPVVTICITRGWADWQA